MQPKSQLVSASILAFLAVAFGAMGAHALKKILTPEELQSFETAVKYQFYHALALLALGVLATVKPAFASVLKTPSLLLLLGTLCFSVSIYLLVLSFHLGINLSFLGPVTPIGGTLLLIGWGLLIKLFIQTES